MKLEMRYHEFYQRFVDFSQLRILKTRKGNQIFRTIGDNAISYKEAQRILDEKVYVPLLEQGWTMDAIDKMDIYHYLELQTLNPKEKQMNMMFNRNL